jgi:hypothetical protein
MAYRSCISDVLQTADCVSSAGPDAASGKLEGGGSSKSGGMRGGTAAGCLKMCTLIGNVNKHTVQMLQSLSGPVNA